MANFISGTDYLTIANHYATARNLILSAGDDFYDAFHTIVLLSSDLPSVDLLTEFYSSYQLNVNQLQSPVFFLSAVRSLNNHVLNRGSFATLHAYYADQNIDGQIPRAWADLSVASGFTVLEADIA